MGKWTDAAKVLRATMDARDEKATDLEIILAELAKLPPGQLKKVLTEPVIAVLEKYGVSLEE